MKYIMYAFFAWFVVVCTSDISCSQFDRYKQDFLSSVAVLQRKYRKSDLKAQCRSDESFQITNVQTNSKSLSRITGSYIVTDEEKDVAEYHNILKKIIEDVYDPFPGSPYFHYRHNKGCSTGHEVVIFVKHLNGGFVTIPDVAKDKIVEKVSNWYGYSQEKAVSFFTDFERQEKIHPVSAEEICNRISRRFL
jgi:hypothetical protein